MGEIILPSLGEGIKQARIAVWHFREGDRVYKDQDVVEVQSDKAIFSISVQQDGTLLKILVQEGEDADIGALLAILSP